MILIVNGNTHWRLSSEVDVRVDLVRHCVRVPTGNGGYVGGRVDTTTPSVIGVDSGRRPEDGDETVLSETHEVPPLTPHLRWYPVRLHPL